MSCALLTMFSRAAGLLQAPPEKKVKKTKKDKKEKKKGKKAHKEPKEKSSATDD